MSGARIAHVALWCADIERAAAFWQRYFAASVGEPYSSARRPGFVSRFVRLADGVAIELMSAPWLAERAAAGAERPGWAHVAIALESRAAVDRVAEQLQGDGRLIAAPRRTGDGYYEALAADEEGNLVEITA